MAGPCLDPDSSRPLSKVISKTIRGKAWVPDDAKEVLLILLGVLIVQWLCLNKEKF